MKHWWMIVVVIGFLAGCTDPMNVRLPIENGELSESEDFKAVVQKLSKEDQDMLLAYSIRAAMVAAMTGTPMTSVTIGEAISSQKKFLADQKEKADKEAAEQAKKAAAEKAERDAYEAKLKAFRNKVSGVLLEKWYVPADFARGRVQDGMFFHAKFTNNTDKRIVGMKGTLNMNNTLGDNITGLNIAIEENIDPGLSLEWKGGFRYNEFMEDHVAIRNSEISKIVSSWQPSMIMYEDGTVERME